MTTRLTIADLLTPEGWRQRAAEEAAAGRAVIAAVWCRTCNGAVPKRLPNGRLVHTRVVREFGARACKCGDSRSEGDIETALGISVDRGAYGTRSD